MIFSTSQFHFATITKSNKSKLIFKMVSILGVAKSNCSILRDVSNVDTNSAPGTPTNRQSPLPPQIPLDENTTSDSTKFLMPQKTANLPSLEVLKKQVDTLHKINHLTELNGASPQVYSQHVGFIDVNKGQKYHETQTSQLTRIPSNSTTDDSETSESTNDSQKSDYSLSDENLLQSSQSLSQSQGVVTDTTSTTTTINTMEKTINIFDWDEAISPTNHMRNFSVGIWQLLAEHLSVRVINDIRRAELLKEAKSHNDTPSDNMDANVQSQSEAESTKDINDFKTDSDVIAFAEQLKNDYIHRNICSIEKICEDYMLDPNEPESKAIYEKYYTQCVELNRGKFEEDVKMWKMSLDTTNQVLNRIGNNIEGNSSIIISNGSYDDIILKNIQFQVILDLLYYKKNDNVDQKVGRETTTSSKPLRVTKLKNAKLNLTKDGNTIIANKESAAAAKPIIISERAKALNFLKSKVRMYIDTKLMKLLKSNVDPHQIQQVFTPSKLGLEFSAIFNNTCFKKSTVTTASNSVVTVPVPDLLDIKKLAPLYRTLTNEESQLPVITYYELQWLWKVIKQNLNQRYNGSWEKLLSHLKTQAGVLDFHKLLYQIKIPSSSICYKMYTKIIIKLVETQINKLNNIVATTPSRIMLDCLNNDKKMSENQNYVKQFSTQIVVKEMVQEILTVLQEIDSFDQTKLILNLNSIGDNPDSEGKALKHLEVKLEDFKDNHINFDISNIMSLKLRKKFYRIPIIGNSQNWELVRIWSNFLKVYDNNITNYHDDDDFNTVFTLGFQSHLRPINEDAELSTISSEFSESNYGFDFDKRHLIEYLDPVTATEDFLMKLQQLKIDHEESDFVNMITDEYIDHIVLNLDVVLSLWMSCREYFTRSTEWKNRFDELQSWLNHRLQSSITTKDKVDILLDINRKVGPKKGFKNGLEYLMNYHEKHNADNLNFLKKSKKRRGLLSIGSMGCPNIGVIRNCDPKHIVSKVHRFLKC